MPPGSSIDRSHIEAAERGSETLDELLAELAQSSDASALDVLLYAIVYHRLAEPGARSVVRDDHGVDEVMQDTLIGVASSLDSFRGEAKFTTWLYSVARFKALAYRRRTTTSPDELDDNERVGDAGRISSMIAERTMVADAMTELPDHYREPVWMRDVGGLSYDDIAEKLDLKVNTVRSRISRGRALVAAQLTDLTDLG